MRWFLFLLVLLVPSVALANISWVQTGTGSQGTASVAPSLPATGVVAGDIFVMCVVNKPILTSPSGPTTPAATGTHGAFIAIANNQGSGTDVTDPLEPGTNDRGGTQVTLFYYIAAANGESGTVTSTITGANATYAQIIQYHNTTGLWSVTAAQGGDSTYGANYSAQLTVDPGLTTDDMAVACNGKTVGTIATTQEALTTSGVVYDTAVERWENGTTNGDNNALIISEHPVVSGDSGGALTTATYTHAASTVGGTVILRMRQSGGTPPPPGCTTTLTSLAQAIVQTAITNADTGATICFAASTDDVPVTWNTTSPLTPSVKLNKGVTLQGNTVCTGNGTVATPVTCTDHTIIVDGTAATAGSDPLFITGTNARITGFSFRDTRAPADSGPFVRMQCASCRADHNSWVISTVLGNSAKALQFVSYNGVTSLGTQLADHNYFREWGNGVVITGEIPGEAKLGSYSWTLPITMGDALAVYIEDNNFDNVTHHNGAWDAYWGSSVVYRYNRSVNLNMGGHGFDSADRSTIRQELYRNIVTTTSDIMPEWFGTRGGTHYLWQNTITQSGTGSFGVHTNIRYYRSHPKPDSFLGTLAVPPGTNKGICGEDNDDTAADSDPWPGLVGVVKAGDGIAISNGGTIGALNIRDGNTPGQHGYPCRDQPGYVPGPTHATNLLDWPYVVGTIASPMPAFSQVLSPMYSWNNSFKGAPPTSANINIQAVNPHIHPSWPADDSIIQGYHVLNNRDSYVEVASFDGSAGTGTGASDPAVAFPTCADGVGYFRTNVGSWNTSGDGQGSGLLYRCHPANTWTVFYTPYAYPHPLQTTFVPPLPQSPSGLRTIGASSPTSCTLVWTASAMAGQLGYHVYHGRSPGVYDTIREVTAATAATTHTPLTQQTFLLHQAGTHYFSVTAYNADGDTAYANEITCTSTGFSRTAATGRPGG